MKLKALLGVPLVLLAALLAGCFQSLTLVESQDELSDAGPLDAELADTLPDSALRDAGTAETGPGDADLMDTPDLGEGQTAEERCQEVSEATLCLGDREGFEGSELSVPIAVGLPRGCEGTGGQTGTLSLPDARFILVNPETEGCLVRTQTEGVVVWRARTEDEQAGCPRILGLGIQDTLRLRIASDTPPGTYPLQWIGVLLNVSSLPSTCSGEIGLGGSIRVVP